MDSTLTNLIAACLRPQLQALKLRQRGQILLEKMDDRAKVEIDGLENPERREGAWDRFEDGAGMSVDLEGLGFGGSAEEGEQRGEDALVDGAEREVSERMVQVGERYFLSLEEVVLHLKGDGRLSLDAVQEGSEKWERDLGSFDARRNARSRG